LAFCLFPGLTLGQNKPPKEVPSKTEIQKKENILEISFQGLHTIEEAVVADVASLRVGEEFTYDKLENSINSLRKWGVFSQVEVLVEHEAGGVRLSYDLKEGYIIKDIKISGNYPLLESRVRTALFINPGDIYDNTRLPEQLDRLDRLYSDEGYFMTTVFAIEDYDEAEKEVTLHFKIQKGGTYHLRNTNVEGNTALNPKRIQTIIFTYSHYKPRQIKKDLAKIQDLYKKKGYVRARVRLEDEIYDYDAKKVDIDVGIRQGKRVFVEFEGNDHFLEKALKKQLTLIEDGDFDDYELDSSKQRLSDFYKEHGYDSVQVSWIREKIDKDNFLVTFNIHEGPQRRIKKIEFEGAKGIQGKKLKDVIVSHEESISDSGFFIQPLFEEDLKLIEDYYKKEGYLDAKVESWEKSFNDYGDKLNLSVKIDENQKALVHSLNINGLDEALKSKVMPLLSCKPGQPYSPTRLLQDVQWILVKLSNSGYPYAQIQHHETKINDSLWDITLDVDMGHKVTIGRLLFVGNFLTKEKVIRKNLHFKEGSVFSAQDLLQSQINLRQLGIFDRVSIETLGLANKEEVVNALISMQEKKSKIIDLKASYNTDEGFTGQLTFNKLNMWGSGKNGNIKIQAGQEISRFELNYIDPRLAGSSLQLLVGGFVGLNRLPFFQNFQTGVLSTLFKNFGPHMNAYGRLQFDAVNFDESKTVASQLGPRQSGQDTTRLATTAAVTYDMRDNYGNPTRGYYINGTTTFTNQFIQQSGNYFTTRATLGDWYSPFRKLTVANALRVAKIFPVPGNTSIPSDDRLYLGGDDTVRGYDQDSLLPSGGLFSMVYNLELQFNVFKNFQVVGFLDSGIVIDNMSQFNLHNFREGIGPGVRYLTPVGPIRLEYGFKINPRAGESIGRLTASFGYFF
jgi:outer membrane protein insertion porin family